MVILIKEKYMKKELAGNYLVKKPIANTKFNRLAYGLMVVLGIVMLVKGNIGWGGSNLGLALVFDPFNPAVSWHDRPIYQKAWLMVHVVVVYGLLGYGFLAK